MGSIPTNEYDEQSVDTCFDFIMQDNSEDFTMENLLNGTLVVFIDDKDKQAFCYDIEDFCKVVETSPLFSTCPNGDEVYMKMVTSPGGGNGLVEWDIAKLICKSVGPKIFHLKFEKTFSKTRSLFRDGNPTIVSSYHCQEGSNQDLYSVKQCKGGGKCKIPYKQLVQVPESQLRDYQKISGLNTAVLAPVSPTNTGPPPITEETINLYKASIKQFIRENPRKRRLMRDDFQKIRSSIPNSNRSESAYLPMYRIKELHKVLLEEYQAERERSVRSGSLANCNLTTHEIVNGRCLKKCGPGQVRNPATSRCRKIR